MGSIECHETSVTHYHSTLRKSQNSADLKICLSSHLFTFMFIRLSTINISRQDEITLMKFDNKALKCREHVQIMTKLHKRNEIFMR